MKNDDPSYPSIFDVNPATGLPIINDAYVDVGGSPYGQDIHQIPFGYDHSWQADDNW